MVSLRADLMITQCASSAPDRRACAQDTNRACLLQSIIFSTYIIIANGYREAAVIWDMSSGTRKRTVKLDSSCEKSEYPVSNAPLAVVDGLLLSCDFWGTQGFCVGR